MEEIPQGKKKKTSLYLPEPLFWRLKQSIAARQVSQDATAIEEAIRVWLAADIPALKQYAAQHNQTLEEAAHDAVLHYLVPKDYSASMTERLESGEQEESYGLDEEFSTELIADIKRVISLVIEFARRKPEKLPVLEEGILAHVRQGPSIPGKTAGGSVRPPTPIARKR